MVRVEFPDVYLIANTESLGFGQANNFECTNMPPYAHAVQEEVGLPIFHIFSLIDMVFQSFHWKPYEGFM